MSSGGMDGTQEIDFWNGLESYYEKLQAIPILLLSRFAKINVKTTIRKNEHFRLENSTHV